MRAFLFVLEITPLQVHRIYPRGLPLHCTVLHWFRTQADGRDVLDRAAGIIKQTSPIRLTSQREAWFGLSEGPRNILVNLIQPTTGFRHLHASLLGAMNELGVEHTEPTYTGDGFHAHVTKQEEGQFVEGSQHIAAATYLVEALDPIKITKKRIVARIPHKS
jgi:2'-5' RNA ligase